MFSISKVRIFIYFARNFIGSTFGFLLVFQGMTHCLKCCQRISEAIILPRKFKDNAKNLSFIATFFSVKFSAQDDKLLSEKVNLNTRFSLMNRKFWNLEHIPQIVLLSLSSLSNLL